MTDCIMTQKCSQEGVDFLRKKMDVFIFKFTNRIEI